jgi:hypothetical protein
MNRGRVGEERGGKETDGCPLTIGLPLVIAKGSSPAPVLLRIFR